MRLSDAFPSKYLKAADLRNKAVDLTITKVIAEEIGNDLKLVAYFDGAKKGLVLNKTNSEVIGSRYGDETNGWPGAGITIYPDKVAFQGQIVDCIRVRLPVESADPEDLPPL